MDTVAAVAAFVQLDVAERVTCWIGYVAPGLRAVTPSGFVMDKPPDTGSNLRSWTRGVVMPSL